MGVRFNLGRKWVRGIYAYQWRWPTRNPALIPPRGVLPLPMPCAGSPLTAPLAMLAPAKLPENAERNSTFYKLQTIELLGTWFSLSINEKPSFGLEYREVSMFHRARRVVEDVHLNCIRALEACRFAHDVH